MGAFHCSVKCCIALNCCGVKAGKRHFTTDCHSRHRSKTLDLRLMMVMRIMNLMVGMVKFMIVTSNKSETLNLWLMGIFHSRLFLKKGI